MLAMPDAAVGQPVQEGSGPENGLSGSVGGIPIENWG